MDEYNLEHRRIVFRDLQFFVQRIPESKGILLHPEVPRQILAFKPRYMKGTS